MSEIQFPEMPRQYDMTRSVSDNEILLVFVNDEDAERFYEWIEGDGWATFQAWVDEQNASPR